MSEPNDDVDKHLLQVGLICAQWAHLEYLLELTVWWLLGLLDTPKDARLITGTMPIDALARKARDLAHRKIPKRSDRNMLRDVAVDVNAVEHERNLAVHGVRSLWPDETITASVPRGPYRNKPERLSLIRLRTANAQIASTIAKLELLLDAHSIIEGVTAISERNKSPER